MQGPGHQCRVCVCMCTCDGKTEMGRKIGGEGHTQKRQAEAQRRKGQSQAGGPGAHPLKAGRERTWGPQHSLPRLPSALLTCLPVLPALLAPSQTPRPCELPPQTQRNPRGLSPACALQALSTHRLLWVLIACLCIVNSHPTVLCSRGQSL